MIKFVYFDVGGVVIKDFSGTNKWEELRVEIGITSANQTQFDKLWNETTDTRDTTFNVDQLVPLLRKNVNINLPNDYSLLMGFVNRFEKNESILPVLLAIQKEVPMGLLTNMYPRMLDNIYTKDIMPSVNWDVVIDSSIVKIKKPDLKIYKLAEGQAMVKGNNILFVDNSQTHLDATQKNFGWQTFLFNPKKSKESSVQLLNYFNLNKY